MRVREELKLSKQPPTVHEALSVFWKEWYREGHDLFFDFERYLEYLEEKFGELFAFFVADQFYEDRSGK